MILEWQMLAASANAEGANSAFILAFVLPFKLKHGCLGSVA